MPTWILELIENLGPLTTTVEGIVKIGQAIATEISGSDNPVAKAAAVAGDVANAATEIDTALHANTVPPTLGAAA